MFFFFFFQAEDGIRDLYVTGVQTCALPISRDVWAMKDIVAQKLKIDVGTSGAVSALLMRPREARACFVFAHGAGAGITHPAIETMATGLAERGVATLRYQFPYMERGSKRPDPPAVAQAAARARVPE